MQAPQAESAGDGWLRLSRTQIMRMFGVSSAQACPRSAKSGRDVARLQAEGDTVWISVNKVLQFRLAMAGRGDRVHSLRVYVPIVNLSPARGDKVVAILRAFLTAEFPHWKEAKDWPTQSMASAWNASGNAMDRKPFSPNDIITRKTIGNETVSTFGVPPDIILYAATARQECIPRQSHSSNPMDDPIQRVVC
ncbi:MAG TPA: hypothetical protein VHX61_17030 [Rhizomicrobium sp.]|nr:hypothetical protein [Rhizomicrobium sp.]